MFYIPVQLSGLDKRRKTIGLLHLVAGFFLIANSESAVLVLKYDRLADLAPLYFVAAVSLVYGFFRKKLDPSGKANLWIRLLQAITFLSLAIAFVQADNWGKAIPVLIWAALSAMLAFTDRVALQKPQLLVSTNGLSFPNGFGVKKLNWEQIESVTLRPDFLTLHLPANKFLQLELKEPLSPDAAEKLQDFCRRQIGKAAGRSPINQ
ncbi:hypothetical protein [Paracnuella aquatica]|uniref:hypothetical protein n=1 Tax=Paracnuella aquatica TaxID=2268757 RepID=UPI000DEFB921|nr:hypothetical protein [Paracnuella aquatica]RPD51380.1 hypothetical protein DRJ53_01465 [Paracnuella aquatica]